jgi:hypothetical protein
MRGHAALERKLARSWAIGKKSLAADHGSARPLGGYAPKLSSWRPKRKEPAAALREGGLDAHLAAIDDPEERTVERRSNAKRQRGTLDRQSALEQAARERWAVSTTD